MEDEKPADGTATPPPPGQFITAEAMNKAFDARFKRFEKNFGTALEQKLSNLMAGKGVGEDEAGDGKEKKAKADPADIDARVKALEAENRKLKSERDENKKRDLANEERDALRSAFKKFGAKEDTLDDLVTARYAEGIVTRDDAGDIVWRTKEGDKPVEQGAKEWLAGDKGKSYLPAQGGRGSGNRAGANGVDPAVKQGPLDDQGLLNHVL